MRKGIMSARWKTAGLAVFSLLAGCGSSNGAGGQSSGADSGAGSGSTNSGVITVGESGLTAAFTETSSPADTTALASMKTGAGSCEATRSTAAHGDIKFVSAGTLTVKAGTDTVTAKPETSGPGGSRVLYKMSQGSFDPGQSLTFTASGETAPAFSIGGVIVPDAISLTQPSLAGATSTVSISRTKDFQVAWRGGGQNGDVTITISQLSGNYSTAVICTFPERAGEGVIPAAILGYLATTGAIGAGDSFSVETSTSKQVMVGEWTITAFANRSSHFAVAFIR